MSLLPNPWKMIRQQEKADKLAAVLRRLNVDADLARAMNAKEWAYAAKLAKCNPPKSQETIDLVAEKLTGVTA